MLEVPMVGYAWIRGQSNRERSGNANPPYKIPTGDRVMNIELRQPEISQKTRLKVIDVDIHPKSGMEDLRPYLAKRWWDLYKTYGARIRQGFLQGFPYPKSQPFASRRSEEHTSELQSLRHL